MRCAVFLDRDGVLNEASVIDGRPYPPVSVDQLRLFPDVRDALGRLRNAGFLLIVATNQPDVSRGTLRREAVDEINAKIGEALPIDEFFVCWHDDADACPCRKPRPGMLFAAAAKHEIDLSRSFMVGDRWRDIEAGHAAGCRTIMIDRDYRERSAQQPPHFQTTSLAEAANWIVANSIGSCS